MNGRPATITWIGIVAVVAAMIVSAIPYGAHSLLADYDLQAVILAITAVSLFVTAQFTREATDYQRDRDTRVRRDRRRALAEAMTTEAKALIGQKTQWKATILQPNVTFLVEYPVLWAGLASAPLFEIWTVQKLGPALRKLLELRATSTNSRERIASHLAAEAELQAAAEAAIDTAVESLEKLDKWLVYESSDRRGRRPAED